MAADHPWQTASDLIAKSLPALRWTIPNLIPEGLALLVAAPKMGKSFFGLNAAVAVATGTAPFGLAESCEAGDALYLDLEMGERRAKARLEMLFPGERPDLSRLSFLMAGDVPTGDVTALLAFLDTWIAAVPNPRLVVLDVLQCVLPEKKGRGTAYELEYAALQPFRDWANRHRVTLLVLHHARKGESSNPIDRASGSAAVTGVPNLVMVLTEERAGYYLDVRGHDVDRMRLKMWRADGWWWSAGEVDDRPRGPSMSETRLKICDAIRERGAMSAKAIADATGLNHDTVRGQLRKMVGAEQLVEMAGKYDLPERDEHPKQGEQPEHPNTSITTEQRNGYLPEDNNKQAVDSDSSSVVESVAPVRGVRAVRPVWGVRGDGDDERAAEGVVTPPPPQQTARPHRSPGITIGDCRTLEPALSGVALQLLRWMADQDNPESWTWNTVILRGIRLTADERERAGRELMAAGLMEESMQSTDKGRPARHYRVAPVAMERLRAIRQRRLGDAEARLF